MSNSLSPPNSTTPTGIDDLFLEHFEDPAIDNVELAIAGALTGIRGQLVAEMDEQGVGIRELARRAGVAASAVSRFLKSEGDMHVSTAVLLAQALEREWKITLRKAIWGVPQIPIGSATEPPMRLSQGVVEPVSSPDGLNQFVFFNER